MSSKQLAVAALLIALALGASWWASEFGIDFKVYHAITRSALFEDGALYGEASGLQYPMWYRYPPVFLFAFAPFALLPVKVAIVVWTLLKCAALALLLRSLSRRLKPNWLLAAAIVGVFVLTEFRYGNAQFFIFALTAGALLLKRWQTAAIALGAAIAFKLWPLFFVPYLAALGRWKTAAAGLAVAAGLTLAPALWYGWGQHWSNLESWRAQESQIALQGGSIWFPSQSLLGVMTRWLTHVDYESMPDPNYPHINLADLDPAHVRLAWMLIAAVGYAALLAHGRRSGESDALHGVAFCALVFLEPYAQKQTALVVLVWPAVVASAGITQLPWAPYAAAFLTLMQPITQSAYWNRVYQVWGVDALTMLLLALTLVRSGATEPRLQRSGRRL